MNFAKKFDLIPNRQRARRRLRFSRMRLQQGLSILPNLFTLGNAFFGFCSIIFAAHGDVIAAAYFILVGALFDGLDGRIARLARVTSELGMQLDSLCDGITFCLAPAFLVYTWQLKKTGFLGLAACALFLMAGLLRLAKFNLTHSQQSSRFSGIPTTIAGCFLATVVLNAKKILANPSFCLMLLLLMVTLSGLMVSSIPFPAFKQLRRNTYTWGMVGLAIIAIAFGLTRMLFLLFIAYFIFGFGSYVRDRLRRQ